MIARLKAPADRQPSRGRFAVTAVLLTTLCVLPLGMISITSALDRTNTLTKAEELWVPVRAASSGPSVSVDLALAWTPTPAVLAPAWSGIVTAVSKQQGSTVGTGDVLAEVDGVKRMAVHSRAPFHRALGPADKGTDVEDLNAFLSAQQLSPATGPAFTAETLRGVRKLAASLGAPGAISSFDPAWVVYLPEESVFLAHLDLTVGAPAPAAGTEIVPASATLAGATLVAADTMFTEVSPGEAPQEIDLALIQNPEVVTEDTLDFGEGDSLRVSGTSIPFDATGPTMPAAGLEALTRLLTPGQSHIRGILTRALTEDGWVVPASAVFATTTGKTCVLFRERREASAVPVQVTGDEAGSSTVVAALSGIGEVQVAPEVRARTCQ